MATTDYYLNRGMRQIGTALPVDLVVEFDQRVAMVPFRSRTWMIAAALRHFLDCPLADWDTSDDPPRTS